MQARLKVIQDNANLKQVKLLPITIIGRGADCHLKIASIEVSRKHCRLTVTDDVVLVEDLNSSNGTFLNDQRLMPSQATPVLPGAILAVGPAKFMVDYTLAVAPEAAPTMVIRAADVAAANAIAVGSPPLSRASELPIVVPAKLPVTPNDTVFGNSPSEETILDPPAVPAVVASPPPFPALRDSSPTSKFAPETRPFDGDATERSAKQASTAPTDIEPPVETSGGVKSLFGLFGRKSKPAPAAAMPADLDSEDTAPPSHVDSQPPPSNAAKPSNEQADPFDFLKGV